MIQSCIGKVVIGFFVAKPFCPELHGQSVVDEFIQAIGKRIHIFLTVHFLYIILEIFTRIIAFVFVQFQFLGQPKQFHVKEFQSHCNGLFYSSAIKVGNVIDFFCPHFQFFVFVPIQMLTFGVEPNWVFIERP